MDPAPYFSDTAGFLRSLSYSLVVIGLGTQGGGAMEAKPPLDQWNLLISGGFHAPAGAEPPPGKKKIKNKFQNTTLVRVNKHDN